MCVCVCVFEIRCCYHSRQIADCYSHLGCYTHNVSPAILSDLLQVPFVALGNLPRIQNITLHWNHGGKLFSF